MSYLGEEIKKLGFGLMRLPQADGKIDIEQTKIMVDKFLEAGFVHFFLVGGTYLQEVIAGSEACHRDHSTNH